LRLKTQEYTGVSINTLYPSGSFTIERYHPRGTTFALELDAEGDTLKVERASALWIDLKGHGAVTVVWKKSTRERDLHTPPLIPVPGKKRASR
jgi:hypothetical protein